MSNSTKTNCPYDCYDACEILYKDNRFRGSDDKITSNYLCQAFKNISKKQPLANAIYKGKPISLDKALDILIQKLKNIKPSKSIYYKGSGNFGKLSNSTREFFAQYGSVEANGSLCDGSGLEGVIGGRGSSRLLPTHIIKNAEVVVLWGRDAHITNSHLLPFIKNKSLIVIDPIKTQSAKNADLHLQIRPNSDLLLALIIARFIIIENSYDLNFIQKRVSGGKDAFEEFYELTQTLRIKDTLEKIDITLGDIGKFLSILNSKKIVFLIGIGVQKYLNGDEILRAIDSLGAILGLFGKNDSGIAYLAQSSYGFIDPFIAKFNKSVSKVDVNFSQYDLVFIQGANPAHSMPNSQKIIKELESSFVVNFGMYDDESVRYSDLFIPSESFLAKKDIRFSYFHEKIRVSKPIIKKNPQKISEYELAQKLCSIFGYTNLQSEDNYIQDIVSSYKHQDIPYSEYFDTKDAKFILLDEIEGNDIGAGEFYLITKKSPTSINSMHLNRAVVYLNKNLGYNNGDNLLLKSKLGEAIFEAKIDNSLRDDCILIYSNTKNVNILTSNLISYKGNSATYQNIKVDILKNTN